MAQGKDAAKQPASSPPIATVGYDVHPQGTVEKPLILRTYVPDPGLEDAVLGNHGKAAPSPKYSPRSGKDVKGTYQPIDGIPAAITVNHGRELSYVWDDGGSPASMSVPCYLYPDHWNFSLGEPQAVYQAGVTPGRGWRHNISPATNVRMTMVTAPRPIRA